MINTGEKLELKNKVVVDKHCTGGVAGNRTTMIVIPIVAAAGLVMPKTSSRAITSPAGTADTMEVLCPVTLSLDEMKKVVKKTNACLVWGGAMNLAPATPQWLRDLNATPMKLGLDLRGGIHFLMEVDIDSAVANRMEFYTTALKRKLREEKIRGFVKLEDGRLRGKFKTEELSDKAASVVRKEFPDLQK